MAEEPLKDVDDAAQLVIQVIGVAPRAIKNEEEYNEGMKWLANVGSRRKKVEQLFTVLDKPLRDSMATIKKGLAESKERQEKLLEPLVAEENKLRKMTADFFMAQKRKREEEQAEINRKNQEKVDKAVAAGKPAESVAPPRVVFQLPTTVRNEGGPTATMRLIKQWRVKNAPKFCQAYKEDIYRNEHPELVTIPDSCWVLDRAKANNAAKSGLAPALELYDVPSQAING